MRPHQIDALPPHFLTSYGLIARSALPERTQRKLILANEARSVSPGILARPPASELERWWQELAIAVVGTWPDGAASRSCAAALWNLDSFEIGKVPVSVDARLDCAIRSPSVHRTMCRASNRDGFPFPVTTVVETLLRLAGERFHDLPWITPFERFELALESALRQGLLTVDEIAAAIAEAPRNLPGKALVRQFLAGRVPGLAPTESFLETRCVQVLRRYGIDDMQRQVNIYDRRGFIGRVDFVFMGVVIPCDSVEWHDNREAFFKDRERRSRLQALGHPVIEVTSQRLETFGYEVACDILGARSLFRRAG